MLLYETVKGGVPSVIKRERILNMKKFTAVFLTAALMFLFAGCSAKVVIPEEVLQLPEHSEVYTACNLWYNDGEKADKAAEIDELNIMKGKILPFGTRIEFLPSDENGIAFKTVNGNKVFRFRYEQARNVEPVETVIRKFFTTKTPEELASGIRPLDLEKIRRGLVEKGMRRKEVLLGYGNPPPLRTPVLNVDTWTYFVDFGVTKRVIFFDDRVIDIIQLD